MVRAEHPPVGEHLLEQSQRIPGVTDLPVEAAVLLRLLRSRTAHIGMGASRGEGTALPTLRGDG